MDTQWQQRVEALERAVRMIDLREKVLLKSLDERLGSLERSLAQAELRRERERAGASGGELGAALVAGPLVGRPEAGG